ncbi:hypothetical protein [Oceanobacillus halophilus]|uniref:Uncharacterized protein n=1 Tax=Oceanobacillus halophilus TaxID=930130 RepID=A0A495ACG0_9BACI|nr:hypothetical protein [Oceanobacillus halophilus]RKQ37320.1 hypothetical protein D8M06_00515 [Oceanobacillus halophilus]
MKKMIIIVFILFLVFFVYIFASAQGEVTRLDKEKSIEKKLDDFILHMKVERGDNGIKIHHSLQYVGDESIRIEHQTPLVSISLQTKNHDFTGSMVPKYLQKGSIYYQEPVTLSTEGKGEKNLYVKAKFLADGEPVNIEHVETLRFN